MSVIDKQQLIKDLEKSLHDKLTGSDSDIVCDELLKVMNKYNVEVDTSTVDTHVNEEYVQMFVDAKMVEGRSEKTIGRYILAINTLLNHAKVPIPDITVYHIRSFFMYQKRRGLADITIEGNRFVYSSFFGWLFREKLIENNPMNNIQPIKYREEVKLPFSKVEIEKIKDSCETIREKAIVTFLLATGCRIGEVRDLNRTDVDFVNKEVIVLGKGNKERTVYLDDISVLWLKKYLDQRKDELPALFIGKRNERFLPNGVRYMLKQIEERSGVPNVHPHRFRRTLATNLIDRGMPIQEVAKILGHEKIDTTMTYVYIGKEKLKNAYRQYA